MISTDLSSMEQYSTRNRAEKELEADTHYDDVGTALLPYKTRPASWTSCYGVPRMTAVYNYVTRGPSVMSQRARYLRLCAFICIESRWLGFTLFSHFRVIITGSDRSALRLPGGLTVNYDILLKSGLSTVGIAIQLIALLPVAEITVEIYSGEWAYILASDGGRLIRITDRVSTLTASFTDRFAHSLDKSSSRLYRIAFAIALLSLILQAIAPGALTISSDVIRTDMSLTIGALDAGQTDQLHRLLTMLRAFSLSKLEK